MYTAKVHTWSNKNRVVLKCKEIRILFIHKPEQFDATTIDGKELEVVKSAK